MATMYEFLSSRPKSGAPGKLKSDMVDWDSPAVESRDYVVPVRCGQRKTVVRISKTATSRTKKGSEKSDTLSQQPSQHGLQSGSSVLVTQMVSHKHRSRTFDEESVHSDVGIEQAVTQESDETKSTGSSCLKPDPNQIANLNEIEYIKLLYEKKCDKCAIVPMGLFMRQIAEEELDLHFNTIGDLGMKALIAPITMCPKLTTINLQNTSIGDDGVRYLIAGLLQKEGVRSLNLSDNKITSVGGDAICQLIKRSKSLRSLNLSGNTLGDKFAKTLANALHDTNLLSELNLKATGLGLQGGKYLGPALGINDTVTDLNLSWNSIRLEGAIALANGLKKNLGLLKLDISWNGFSWDGSEALGDALIKNNTLTHIDMSNNRIFDKGVFKFMKGLQRNQALEVLILNANPISPEGALGIIKSIAQNPHKILQHLELQGVPIREPFLKLLGEHQETCPDFQVIYEMTKDNIQRKTAVEILFEFLLAEGKSLEDIFGLDGAQNEIYMNKGAFLEHMLDANSPLSEIQIEEMANILSKKDGTVLGLGYLFRKWESFKGEQESAEKS